MLYFIELVKGILLGIGVMFGLLLAIAFLVHKARKSEETYEPEDLLEPFEKYLKETHDNENYEEIKELEKIIQSLKDKKVEEEVQGFRIKKDVSVQLSDEDGKSTFKLLKKYIILGKKPKTEE